MSVVAREHRAPTEAELISIAKNALLERLPATWQVNESDLESAGSSLDSQFMILSPDGVASNIGVRVKRLLRKSEVLHANAGFASYLASAPNGVGLIVARYIAPATRQQLIDLGLSYVDATGNIHIRADSPALYIADRGADKDPWRGPGRPLGGLVGEPAAKVVRTLIDKPGPWKVRQLVQESGTSTGSVYRVVDFLEFELLLHRSRDGYLSIPEWPALLQRWSEDYQVLGTNAVSRWLAPRGLEDLLSQMRNSDIDDYALTGSIAAATWESYAPVRSAMIYCHDVDAAARAWGLRETDSGNNVVLIQPKYSVALKRRIQRQDGLYLASPAQVVIDLLTGPGRSPSEGVELIDWMERHEELWRI